MSCKDVVENVVSKVKGIRGVHQVFILTGEDKRKVSELERQAEQKVMMGLGLGDNRGIKEALKRNFVIAFVTDADYEWPPGPNVVLECRGEVIGEEVSDSKKLEELRKSKDIVSMGNFVLHKNKISKLSPMAKEPPLVAFPPKSCPQVENVPGACNTAWGCPSPPACIYLKRRMGADLEDSRFGTVLVGFNPSR